MSKAFDVVNHQSMLNALHSQGIKGNLWRMYESMYTYIKCVVKWKGKLSNHFGKEQEIRQGNSSSSGNFKAGRNLMLNQLDRNPTNRNRHIHTSAIMVADNLTLTATSAEQMQHSLNIANRKQQGRGISSTQASPMSLLSTPQHQWSCI